MKDVDTLTLSIWSARHYRISMECTTLAKSIWDARHHRINIAWVTPTLSMCSALRQHISMEVHEAQPSQYGVRENNTDLVYVQCVALVHQYRVLCMMYLHRPYQYGVHGTALSIRGVWYVGNTTLSMWSVRHRPHQYGVLYVLFSMIFLHRPYQYGVHGTALSIWGV